MTKRQRAATIRRELSRMSRGGWDGFCPDDYLALQAELRLLDAELKRKRLNTTSNRRRK